MRPSARALLLGLLAGMGFSQSGHAAITYVDATTANTTLQGGIVLVPGSNCTTGSEPRRHGQSLALADRRGQRGQRRLDGR